MGKTPTRNQLNIDLAALNRVPHVADWFGLWVIEPGYLERLASSVRSLDWPAHFAEFAARSDAAELGARGDTPATGSRVDADSFRNPIIDGIVIIPLRGMLMKQFESSLSVGTSTVRARQMIRRAVADSRIRAIMLHVDSPGGTMAGTDDLARDVADAAKQKPLWAYCEDLCASAAYYVASQAGRVLANPSGLVGSIGIYVVIPDYSRQADADGVTVHVIRQGEFKGAGVPGTPITDSQLAEWQRLIDSGYSQFIESVAAGRKLKVDQVRELGDGRVHPAADAVRLKLIDGISTIDDAVAELRKLVDRSTGRGAAVEVSKMNGQDDTPRTAATVAEIRGACKGASDAFIVRATEKGWSVAEALAAFVNEQAERVEAAEKAAAAAEQARADAEADRDAAQAAATRGGGVPPIGGAATRGKGAGQAAAEGDGEADADGGDFAARVEAYKAQGLNPAAATKRAIRDDPDGHRAYIDAMNANRGRPKMDARPRVAS